MKRRKMSCKYSSALMFRVALAGLKGDKTIAELRQILGIALPMKTFDDDFKKNVVRLVLEERMTIAQVSEDLGCSNGKFFQFI